MNKCTKTPNEALDNVIYCNGFDEDVEILANALKDYTNLQREYSFLGEHYTELLSLYNKEHDALEIIKEIVKLIDCNISFTVNKEIVIQIGKTIRCIKLPEDEYITLKEVLL